MKVTIDDSFENGYSVTSVASGTATGPMAIPSAETKNFVFGGGEVTKAQAKDLALAKASELLGQK